MKHRTLPALLGLALVPLLLGGLAAPAGADGVTVTVGPKATLTSRLLVTLPITVTCPSSLTVAFASGNASVQQAVGKQIAQASGEPDLSAVICDDTPHSLLVTMVPQTGPPFHGGSAIAVAGVQLCDEFFNCMSASSGWQKISFHS